MIINNISN